MSDSLAFSVSLPRANLSDFVAQVAVHVEPPPELTEQWLIECAAGRVAGASLPLTLRFPPDAALEQFGREHPEIIGSTPGTVAFGYVHVAARQSGDLIEVTLFSSSRAIVQVLRESSHVRGFCRSLGRLGSPPVVLVTDEWNDTSEL